MHVKRIHEMVECLTERALQELNRGVETVDTEEFSKVIDSIKDLSESEYYAKISKAMDESDADEIMEMFDRFGDGRRFYDHYRYGDGRFAPKGRGTYRRGYEEPYWRMTPEMYRMMDMWGERDMDRDKGRMYYTEPMSVSDGKEGQSGMSRRTYMESKELHKSNSQEDKQAKMMSLEMYMKDLAKDITGMIAGATPEEKSLLKTKMQTLMQSI